VTGSRLLFNTRLGELISREPVTCPPDATARDVARTMREESADSAVISRDGQVVGILTDMELRNKVIAEALPVETPVEELMSRQFIRLEAGAPVFRALMEMMQHQSYHVVVFDESVPSPGLLGVISDQDISRAQGNNPAFLAERVESTRSLADLSGIPAAIERHLIGLERQGVKPRDLVAINTELKDLLMQRIISLVEEKLREESPDLRVDLPWAWLSLGSEGRGEMSLLTDQDNALVYRDPPSGEAEKAEVWFWTLGERANSALADCGFALCEGGIMARNPRWRHPLSEWKETFRRWISTPDRETLMQVSTFFDLRTLYGESSLVEELKRDILEAFRADRRFLPFMAQNALSNRPPLSFFRRFVLERSGQYRHTFNIKRRGLRPLVDAARVMSIESGYLGSTNTVDRLEHIAGRDPGMAPTVSDALDAYHYLTELRFIHHLRAIERGEEMNNQINPSELNNTQQNMLKAVFAAVKEMQDALAARYGLGTRM
jgi:CBS domain-containing protein